MKIFNQWIPEALENRKPVRKIFKNFPQHFYTISHQLIVNYGRFNDFNISGAPTSQQAETMLFR